MSGATKDISAGGAFIRCREPLRPKEVIELIVIVPRPNSPIKAIAEVIRSNHSDSDDDPKQHGMAVQFIIIPDIARKVISAMVVDHLQSTSSHWCEAEASY